MRTTQEELGGWQDLLLQTSQGRRKGFDEDSREAVKYLTRVRVRVLWLLLASVVVVILARMIYLGVFEKSKHTLLAAGNSLEQVREYAKRGMIYDRAGRELVVSEGSGQRERHYLLGTAGAHLLGYISEVREEELGCKEGLCYGPGDYIGRSGAEKVFESVLKGRDGGKLIEIDAGGREVRELGINESESGSELQLSIDKDLQLAMQRAMGERVGSVVALDMQGKVLGMYSYPSYDPNLFTIKKDQEGLQELLKDTDRLYFLNRAIGGAYAPGSVFKLVTAYAGLESGEISRETEIEDTGEITIDQYRYGNWYFDQYGRTEGAIDVERALARSNDIFFYKLGEMVGVDELVKWARKFGLGEKTGIELPGEVTGLVPDRLWKERLTGERWFLGNTYHLSIGQGDLTATPLQIARMTAAAVSGRLCQVSILKNSESKCESLGLRDENMEIVHEGMRQVCASGGTAFPFFDFAPPVLCKTGTAQHAGQKSESDLPHAWITVAYPADNPEMVLTVMLEAAGEGSYEAGPVAKEILSEWKP